MIFKRVVFPVPFAPRRPTTSPRLIVSHDRYFLDKVVDKVIEIERGTSQVFNGNYSAYAEKKKAQRDAQMK